MERKAATRALRGYIRQRPLVGHGEYRLNLLPCPKGSCPLLTNYPTFTIILDAPGMSGGKMTSWELSTC